MFTFFTKIILFFHYKTLRHHMFKIFLIIHNTVWKVRVVVVLGGWRNVSRTQDIHQSPRSTCKPAGQFDMASSAPITTGITVILTLQSPSSLLSRCRYLTTFSISVFLMFSSIGTTVSIMQPVSSWWFMRMMSDQLKVWEDLTLFIFHHFLRFQPSFLVVL